MIDEVLDGNQVVWFVQHSGDQPPAEIVPRAAAFVAHHPIFHNRLPGLVQASLIETSEEDQAQRLPE